MRVLYAGQGNLYNATDQVPHQKLLLGYYLTEVSAPLKALAEVPQPCDRLLIPWVQTLQPL